MPHEILDPNEFKPIKSLTAEEIDAFPDPEVRKILRAWKYLSWPFNTWIVGLLYFAPWEASLAEWWLRLVKRR